MNEKILLSSFIAVGTSITIFFGTNKPDNRCYDCDIGNIDFIADSLRSVNTSIRDEIKDTLYIGKKAIKELPIIVKKKDSLDKVLKVVRMQLKDTKQDLDIAENELLKKPKELIKIVEVENVVRDTIIIKEKPKYLGVFGRDIDTIKIDSL